MSAVVQLRAREEDAGDAAILAALMEVWSESLAIVEKDSVVRANGAFAQTFGYAAVAEMQGRKLSEFVPESQTVSANAEAEDAGERRDQRWIVGECKGLYRGGGEIRIEVWSSHLGIAQRELRAIRIRSLPEPGSGDRQLLESQKMEAMGRLVGGVAHDFNNLLTGILLYSDLLIAGLAPDSLMRVYAEEIRQAGSHSAGLIQQLLNLARPHADGAVENSWAEVVSATRNLLSRLLGENIELVIDLEEGAAAVRLGPTPMRQVLLNLLLNARDAMPAGGRIAVSVRNRSGAKADWVELSVADTGCGMDEETQSRMFESFFTTKHSGQGTGLGLATVGRIVKEAGGTIEVASAPGTGTRVTIRLPSAAQNQPRQTQ